MFKWVVGLCAAIYVTLLVFGEAPEGQETVARAQTPDLIQTKPAEPAAPQPEKTKTEPVKTDTVTADVAKPLVETVTTVALDTATETLATQAPELSEAAQDIVNAVATLATEEPVAPQTEQPATATSTDGIGEFWRVTGSTVNLRAGASTQTAVLGQTRRGDSAEVIELLDNGWARVYILDTGQEAYMSAAFLDRERQ